MQQNKSGAAKSPVDDEFASEFDFGQEPFSEEDRRHLQEELQSIPFEVRLAVRDHRQHRGWSQAQLAAALGEIGMLIDATAITRIENGKRAVRVDELWALAAVFRVPVEGILSTLPTLRPIETQIEMEKDQLRKLERGLTDYQQEIAERRDRIAALTRRMGERS